MGAKPSQIEPAVVSVPVPRHVGIIMDGNGRWAIARGLPRREGHRRGVEALRRAVRFAARQGIEYLTLFSFSSENWSRPPDEVHELLNLLRFFVLRDLAELRDSNVHIRVIGERDSLAADIRGLIERAEQETVSCTGLQLIVAFNYGSREEIVRAMRKVAERVASGAIGAQDITAGTLAEELDTFGIPDPDLILRTSGEKRISNFLLWQSAYAEFVFLPVMWPDFSDEEFAAALGEFARRERRYGNVASA
jgi:undecaprenyl diphosphate synthase